MLAKQGVENVPWIAAWEEKDVGRHVWWKVASEAKSGGVSDRVGVIWSRDIERRRHGRGSRGIPGEHGSFCEPFIRSDQDRRNLELE